jgi:glutathione S-transferase
MSEKIKLIASKFSPYCHRVEMVMIEKKIPYEKEEIILSEKPDWFIKDAPLGKVPLLYSNGKPLFESIAICEYLEEFFAENPLHPNNAYSKAWHRGWMEFSNGILSAVFGVMFSQNKEQFDVKKAETISKLALLEQNLKAAPFFDGEKFMLIDACMASSLKPLVFLDDRFALQIFAAHPKVTAYSKILTERPSLENSLPKNYEELFQLFLERKKSYLLSMQLGL